MKWTIAISLLAVLNTASAQQPSIINSAGGNATIRGNFYDFNVGEMVLVETFHTSETQLTQGFLQSEPGYTSPGSKSEVFAENNFITPNSDGVNDVLVFTGLEGYPENQLILFDRAGRKILTIPGYQNNWNGTINGRMLHQDTYYYSLEIGAGRRIRGFVTILHQQY